MNHATLISLLREHAQNRPHQLAYRFLLEGDVHGPVEEMTYGQLAQRAAAVAMSMGAGAAGERALLLYPPGLEFIVGYFGCLMGGIVAVPVYPPDPLRLEKTLPRLRAIVSDCRPRFVLTTSPIAQLARAFLGSVPELSIPTWIATDTIDASSAAQDALAESTPDALAFLQYTSGSTGAPKGVEVTHENLMHNLSLIRRATGADAQSVQVSWLPQYHDLGLIGGVLAPLHEGIPSILMSPLDFLRRPMRWLEAISHAKATHCGGPTFGFDLCVRKSTPAERVALDLSSWRVAFVGAEQIRSSTLDDFARAFAPAHFRRESFLPGYGLAELTLGATWARQNTVPRVVHLANDSLARGNAEDARQGVENARQGVEHARHAEPCRAVVSCGSSPSSEHEIIIVDPDSFEPAPANRVGEVWVRSPSVARGYWERAEETAAVFEARLRDGAGPYLRTGDLGFMRDGELFITGRIKELIIIHGQNHYPYDIERTVEACHPAIRPGCVAAFASTETAGGEVAERLGVALEVSASEALPLTEVVEAVRRAVLASHHVPVERVVMLEPRALPKTTSGKLQRNACRGLQRGSAGVRHSWPSGAATRSWPGGAATRASTPARQTRATSTTSTSSPEASRILAKLVEAFCEVRGVSAAQIDVDRSLVEEGFDSVRAIELAARIEEKLDRAVSPDLVWEYPTWSTLAEHLATTPPVARRRALVELSKAPPERDHELWVSERSLLHLQASSPAQTAYNLFTPLDLYGPADPVALEQAFNTLLQRHTNLRAGFELVDGVPRRRVFDNVTVQVEVEDLVSRPHADQQRAVMSAKEELRHHVFDLRHPPLFRVRLQLLESERSLLWLTINHMAVDGFSLGVLLRELDMLYEANKRGETVSLTAVPWQIQDYACASNAALAEVMARGAAAFPPYPPEGYRLRLDHPRPANPRIRGARRSLAVDPDLQRAVERTAAVHGATLSMAVLVAFEVMLARRNLGGDGDVRFTVVQGNRLDPRLHHLVGYLVYGESRAAWVRDRTLAELLLEARRFVTGERLREQAYNVLMRPPSARVVLNYHNYPLDLPAERMRLRADLRDYAYLWDSHDLFFQVFPSPHHLLVDVAYRDEVLEADTITGMLRSFVETLQAIAQDPTQPAL